MYFLLKPTGSIAIATFLSLLLVSCETVSPENHLIRERNLTNNGMDYGSDGKLYPAPHLGWVHPEEPGSAALHPLAGYSWVHPGSLSNYEVVYTGEHPDRVHKDGECRGKFKEDLFPHHQQQESTNQEVALHTTPPPTRPATAGAATLLLEHRMSRQQVAAAIGQPDEVENTSALFWTYNFGKTKLTLTFLQSVGASLGYSEYEGYTLQGWKTSD